MNKTILLFRFDTLPAVLAVQSAVAPLGIEVRPVGRSDYGKTIAALAEGKTSSAAPYTGPELPGRMMVLCDLADQVGELLPLLNRAGAGPDCLKAILTPSNQKWTPPALYAELSREHMEFQRRR